MTVVWIVQAGTFHHGAEWIIGVFENMKDAQELKEKREKEGTDDFVVYNSYVVIK